MKYPNNVDLPHPPGPEIETPKLPSLNIVLCKESVKLFKLFSLPTNTSISFFFL